VVDLHSFVHICRLRMGELRLIDFLVFPAYDRVSVPRFDSIIDGLVLCMAMLDVCVRSHSWSRAHIPSVLARLGDRSLKKIGLGGHVLEEHAQRDEICAPVIAGFRAGRSHGVT